MYAVRMISHDGHNEVRYYGGTDYRGHIAVPRRLYNFVDAQKEARALNGLFNPEMRYQIERHPVQ